MLQQHRDIHAPPLTFELPSWYKSTGFKNNHKFPKLKKKNASKYQILEITDATKHNRSSQVIVRKLNVWDFFPCIVLAGRDSV